MCTYGIKIKEYSCRSFGSATKPLSRYVLSLGSSSELGLEQFESSNLPKQESHYETQAPEDLEG